MAEIDPSSGNIVSTTVLDGVGVHATFAFAALGEDFWLFTDARVHRFRPREHRVELMQANVGFSIVGAGASTCATGS
ncbi:MAG TPA: hypothetical protein VJT73_14005 [Polyangiaceae bacterium]|nr:hypothetical protein [Polyangiaceae bacterium]